MIASTLQLSLNRAKVSFLLYGSNENFINISRIVGAVSYYNYGNSQGRGETVDCNCEERLVILIIVQSNQYYSLT